MRQEWANNEAGMRQEFSLVLFSLFQANQSRQPAMP